MQVGLGGCRETRGLGKKDKEKERWGTEKKD